MGLPESFPTRNSINTEGMPVSKQRNKHLQSVLIEAAKLGPRLSPDLALIYDTEKRRGQANRASIAVARKLVAYLLAVDRSGTRVRSGKRKKSSGLKSPRTTSRFIQRDLPGPAVDDWATELTLPRLPSKCFGTGR